MWHLQMLLAHDRIAELRREADSHRLATAGMHRDPSRPRFQRAAGILRSSPVARQA